MKPPRIALIHATALAMAPIQQAFARHWPQADCLNLLDDSLSRDRAQAGELTPALVLAQRSRDLAAGQADSHHQRIAKALAQLPPCDGIMLAQFSMAAAQPLCQQHVRVPVFSSPDCAVLALQQAMHHV